MALPLELVSRVYERAANRCEYCLMHQSLQGATFHVEHVVPGSKGGETELGNLALACPSCNLHKADRVEVADPQFGGVVVLFNPRRDRWSDHFVLNGYEIVGRSVVGRATVAALQLNHPRRIQVRKAEELFALFPPVH
jgi:hypothetical protein